MKNGLPIDAEQCFLSFFAPDMKLPRKKHTFAPRPPFSKEQASAMEEIYLRQEVLSDKEITEVSETLEIYSDTRVKTWFRNRRQKQKREAAEVARAMVP